MLSTSKLEYFSDKLGLAGRNENQIELDAALVDQISQLFGAHEFTFP